jgi:heme A synthase
LTAIATYLLIVVGAIVRSTGSGLGCPDWPLCHGQLLPPPNVAAMIEFSHRFSAAIVSALMLAMVAAAWVWARHVRYRHRQPPSRSCWPRRSPGAAVVCSRPRGR